MNERASDCMHEVTPLQRRDSMRQVSYLDIFQQLVSLKNNKIYDFIGESTSSRQATS